MDSTIITLDTTVLDDTIQDSSGVEDEESAEDLIRRAEMQQAEIEPQLRVSKPEPIPSVVIHTLNDAPITESSSANSILLVDDDDDVIFVGQSSFINLCSPEPGPRSSRVLTSNLPIQDNSKLSTIQNPPPNTHINASQVDSPPKENSVICSICLDSAVGNAPHSTNCGHIYCGNCIKEAIRITKKCPLCKKTLNSKSIFPVYI